MHWNITYYNKNVAITIQAWPKKLLAKYLRIVDLIEANGPQLGGVLTKALENGLFEIRVKAQEGIARAFFCYIVDNEIVVLHAFIKKTQKTPKHDLELAKTRMKEVLS